jgi:lipoprotein-releasing system permease protein
MYQLVLCWRYLKTRYLAFVCIISVMLGVATLIVVNSVMNGFSGKLRTLLHSVMSDVIVEAHGFEGFANPTDKLDRIRKDPYLSGRIEAMAATLDAPAVVQFRFANSNAMSTRTVRVVGIEPAERAQVGGYRESLQSYLDYVAAHPNDPESLKDAPAASFAIPEHIRQAHERAEAFRQQQVQQQQMMIGPDGIPLPTPPPHIPRIPRGVVVGHLLAHFNWRNPDTGEVESRRAIEKGQEIVLTTVSGERLTPAYDSFVVVDYFKSGMSDFDGQCVFVPIDHLQRLRAMDNRASSILIKLKDYGDAKPVCDALAKLFAADQLLINTWEEKQGPLLRAIAIEKNILNILLFMIIGVAGFGILSIFSMIVSEKTRDIGILKALGASNIGVMRIFLTYGLLLGIVGAGLGTLLGLTITWNINGIEVLLSMVTGTKVFTDEVYYFNKIPTEVQPLALVIVNLGAMAIAVVFSILPALHAALLQPVQALRYE